MVTERAEQIGRHAANGPSWALENQRDWEANPWNKQCGNDVEQVYYRSYYLV